MNTANIKDGEATEQNNDIDAAFTKHLDIAIEAQDGPATAKEDDKETNADGSPKQPTDSNVSTSDSTAQPKPGEEPKKEEQQTHGAKDLTLQDGTVVKGGSERRFFEQRNVARERVNTLEDENRSISAERDKFRNDFSQLQETVKGLHGADPQSVSIGLQIVNDLQRDPQGTMKKLLAEVVAQGYTVEGIGAGIDTAAITRLIEERLPNRDTSDEANIERITADAHTEASTFFNTFPDAKPHDELLARMLGDNPGLSLQSAYFQLKDAFAEKGFDWTRSLADNVKGSSGQTNNGLDSTGKPIIKVDTPGLPNGGNGQNTDVVVNRGNLAHESEDTGDIVKQAMREAGMKI